MWQGGMHGRGACMMGGVHDWGRGACVAGGMHGRGVCMAGEGGMHGGGVCMAGGCAWPGDVLGRGACVPQQILRDTVNERAVRILLECILVQR